MMFRIERMESGVRCSVAEVSRWPAGKQVERIARTGGQNGPFRAILDSTDPWS
jgi:hypothetical protein